MRIKLALTAWLLALTVAWLAVAPPDAGLWPLVDAQGAASGWWRLRQHALYLTGLWSIGLMSLIMLLALRLPLLEKALGGMDQVYRLHKWAGVGAGVTALMHWGAKEGGGWIKSLWGRAGRPAREAVLPWLTDSRGLAKDLGEWAFYLLLALLIITLVQRLLPYKPWRIMHRVMPLLYLVLAFHSVALMPLTFWAQPLGLLMGTLLALGSLAALWSLGRQDRSAPPPRRAHSCRAGAGRGSGRAAGGGLRACRQAGRDTAPVSSPSCVSTAPRAPTPSPWPAHRAPWARALGASRSCAW